MSAEMSAKITAIHRYPVKGLKPEVMSSVALTKGQTLPFDRKWAIENGPSGFLASQPAHLPKTKFLMLARNERLAQLETGFDEASQTITISRGGKQVVSGALNEKLGRQLIEQFFASFMEKDLRGSPKILSSNDHNFTDVPEKSISIINRATCEDITRVIGQPVHPDRFRGNFIIEGLPAWEEFNWIDKDITIGTAKCQVYSRITRCGATNVDPATAQRDLQIPKTLMNAFGHMQCGLYATVIHDGNASPGDEISPL